MKNEMTAREIKEKIFQKEREQNDLQARLGYIYFNYGKENFNDDALDDFGGDYQYAIETLSGKIEMLKNEILELRNELEDDEPAETPIENNLTVNVLAINGKGKITFNGEVVSKAASMEEFANAYHLFDASYEDNAALLYTDKTFLKKVNRETYCRNEGAVRVVDFGRDEIPYVNEKVDAIIAEYRAKAKAEDEEKARREAYAASDEGRLEDISCKINFVAESVQWNRDLIKHAQKKIIKLLAEIANKENEINEFNLEVAKFEAEIEKLTAEKKALEVKIRNKAMNAVAAEIEDDGTNEDDETVADTYVEDEDDDDELADDLIIIKTEEKVIPAEDERSCRIRELNQQIYVKEREFEKADQRYHDVYRVGVSGYGEELLDEFGGDYEYAVEKLGEEVKKLARELAELRDEFSWLTCEEEDLEDEEEDLEDEEEDLEDEEEDLEDEEKVVPVEDEEKEMTIAAATFDLDRFSEDAPEVTELKEVVTAYKTRCEAEGKLRDKVDEINAKYDAQEAALRKKLKDLEDARCLEMDAAYDELESLGSLHELRNKANAQIETLIEGDMGIKLTENNFGTEKIWKGEKFKMSYLGLKKELMIEIGGRISTYKTVEGFVNAVVELANAINRGDSEYTFPAEK